MEIGGVEGLDVGWADTLTTELGWGGAACGGGHSEVDDAAAAAMPHLAGRAAASFKPIKHEHDF